jgi:2-polyprenyl-3-methyl-5-hydroxy-6-metoxy-1,4-benzoquinol methylase
MSVILKEKSNIFLERNKCPVCHSCLFNEIYRISFSSEKLINYFIKFYPNLVISDIYSLANSDYTLCRCSSCKAIFQKEVLGPEFMKKLYEVWIDSKTELDRKSSLSVSYYLGHFRELLLILTLFSKNSGSLRFLDFGMGWGAWATVAKALGVDSHGVEISAERMNYARRGGVKVINWDDIPHLEFDFINSEQVFEHIPDPLSTLRHLKSGLRPGGILKISVPYSPVIDQSLKLMDWGLDKGSLFSLNPVAPLEHVNYFRRSSILKMGNECGMHEIRIPLIRQYQMSTLLMEGSIGSTFKNIIRPLYNRLGNYVFLQKSV